VNRQSYFESCKVQGHLQKEGGLQCDMGQGVVLGMSWTAAQFTGLNFLHSLEWSGGLTFEAQDLSLPENQWAYKQGM